MPVNTRHFEVQQNIHENTHFRARDHAKQRGEVHFLYLTSESSNLGSEVVKLTPLPQFWLFGNFCQKRRAKQSYLPIA